MRSDQFINYIGASLHHWLNYISSVQRNYVLAESSIRYPVSEFLGTQINKNEIYLEHQHPDLKNKFLDLRFVAQFGKDKFECAMEFKYARIGYTDKTSEKKRIFNDLARLKLFVESKANRKAFFLVCGRTMDFIKAFQSIGWREDEAQNGLPVPRKLADSREAMKSVPEPMGFYTNWMKFNLKDNNGQLNFQLRDSTKVPEEILENFIQKYGNAYKEEMNTDKLASSSLVTKLIYLSDTTILSNNNSSMMVGIWEVTSIPL